MTLPFYGALFRFCLQLLFSSPFSLLAILRYTGADALSLLADSRGFMFLFHFFLDEKNCLVLKFVNRSSKKNAF